MLQNAYFLAKIGADTAENEQHFAEILPIGRRVADCARRSWTSRTTTDLLLDLAEGVAAADDLGPRGVPPFWVANKRIEISKFKFPRARTYETIGLVLGCI